MKDFLKKLYRSWLFEFLLISVLLFVIIAYFNHEIFAGYVSEIENWVVEKGPSMVTGFSGEFLALLSPKILAGFFGGLVLFLIIVWRILWRFRKSAKLKTYTCPKCSNPLVRIHRKGWQKALSKMLPVRRLYCRKCNWRGLRLKEIDNNSNNTNSSTGDTTKYKIDKIKG